jgi:4-hydroxy-tetrahydrodipicolinate reductase
MGRMIISAALERSDIQVVAALDRADSPDLGRDCGDFLGQRTGTLISADADQLAGADVLIDFTRPEATLSHLEHCLAHRVGMVIGTTGFSSDGKARLAKAAHTIGIVLAPNMSVGVQALLQLVELGAQLLDDSYDLEILEMHHRDKVDAPSGTALQIGEIAARARGVSLPEQAVFARQGHTGKRTTGSIGFATLRGGDVIGDHTVIFAGAGERIEISHRSSSRLSYAQGSLRAASFLKNQSNGLFTMKDVLA